MVELKLVPSRPLTSLVVGALRRPPTGTSRRRGPYAPPSCLLRGLPRDDLGAARIVPLCHQLLCSVLAGGEDIDGLADELAPDVVLWTPSLFASSNTSVLRALLTTDADACPLSDTTINVASTDVVPPRVVLAWRLQGRFTESCFVDDDLLVEPTGLLIETAGAFIVTFGPDGVSAMHLYHDAFALTEQLLAAP